MHTPYNTPLTATELVTDRLLNDLRSDDCGMRRYHRRLTDDDVSIVSTILPDICGELMALRAITYTPDQIDGALVCNTALRKLHRDLCARANGTLTNSEHRFLSLALTPICDELLHLRTLTAT